MGRPSKKVERVEQVLQAFQRCIARFGLEGSTLERIAEESGLQRSLVRHFVGNRDELVQQLATRVIEQSDREWALFIEELPEEDTVEVLLDSLFDARHSDPKFVLVIESLIFAAGTNAALQQLMLQWLERFTHDIEAVLGFCFPTAAHKEISAVSLGIISLYFNLDSLAPLKVPAHYRTSARYAAQILVRALK